jgi:hypothetical protein
MKYVFPVVAVVALVLGVINILPNDVLGGQYNTNYSVFGAGLQAKGTSTMENLTVSGTFTPATLEGYVTSSLSTLTVSGASALGTVTMSGITTSSDFVSTDDVVVDGSACVKVSTIYYTLTPSTTNNQLWTWTSSTSPCL